MVQEKSAMQDSLDELRRESFKPIVFITAVIGWIWFSWSAWPLNSYTLFRSEAWITSSLLVLISVASYLIAAKSLTWASELFVGGLLVVFTCCIILFEQPDSAYLYVFPVVFSGALLNQSGLGVVAFAVVVLSMSIELAVPQFYFSDFFIPLFVVEMTSVTIFISTTTLQKALAWALNNYEVAHENELTARENKNKLEQVLKNLDSAMAKLQRTNESLTIARNQAEEARKIKQQFAQTISHELRTPLNLIVGFTETMIKSPEYYGDLLPPVYMRDLSVVYRNAYHLQNLVNDVLDLARLEAAYLSLELEKINLNDVIIDAVQTIRSFIESHGLTVSTELADDLPCIWGDSVRLKQVLLNLMNNAARFTKQGGVIVRTLMGENGVIVAVHDTGVGIPPDDLSDIFEAFRQLENPMQRRADGAGLGLTICKQLIELHGGRIWVESEVGKGSTFFFSLPGGHLEAISAESKGTENAGGSIIEIIPAQRTVLLVTSSSSAAALISHSMSSYRTVVVSRLHEVPAVAQQLLPQAIIVDTGAEAVSEERFKKFIETLTISPACLFTYPLSMEETLRKRLSADAYLIKPVMRENLWTILRQFDEKSNRVLVVDYDQDFVRLMTRMLVSPIRSYQVSYAYSGHEAMQMIRRNKPDILLLDLNLPDMDGQHIIQLVRADPILKHMRIVIITAHEELSSSNLLKGHMYVTKTSGVTALELVKWTKSILGDS